MIVEVGKAKDVSTVGWDKSTLSEHSIKDITGCVSAAVRGKQGWALQFK